MFGHRLLSTCDHASITLHSSRAVGYQRCGLGSYCISIQF